MQIQIQKIQDQPVLHIDVASAHWSFQINPTCEKCKRQIQRIQIHEIRNHPVLHMDVASAHWSFQIRAVKAAASATTAPLPCTAAQSKTIYKYK